MDHHSDEVVAQLLVLLPQLVPFLAEGLQLFLDLLARLLQLLLVRAEGPDRRLEVLGAPENA